MKLTITRNVENNKFKSMIVFEGFGSPDISEVDEKELLENYPQHISLKDIVFEGYADVDDGEVFITDDTDKDKIKLIIPLQREIRINEDFVVKYEISTSQVASDEVGAKLVNKTLVCQAKLLLFEEKIIQAIENKLNAVKGLDNNFEKQSPITVVI